MLHNIFIAVLMVFALATGCASSAKKPLNARGAKITAEAQRPQDALELEQRGKFLDAGLRRA